VWGDQVGRRAAVVAALCVAALTACGALLGKSKLATVAPPAAPPSTTTTSTTAPATPYLVARGDTLSRIAKRFGVTVEAIVASSHLRNQDVLTVGQLLHIPPVAPLTLSVAPSQGPGGTSFTLRLTGIAPTDLVTFSIAPPGHHPFTGPQHTPSPQGTVSASYNTYPTDPTGAYVVMARTSSGKGAFATFRVSTASTSGTSAA
jgi:LysM repeat protein